MNYCEHDYKRCNYGQPRIEYKCTKCGMWQEKEEIATPSQEVTMNNLALQSLLLNAHDNMTLTYDNLINVCVERDQNWDEEKTMWIFADGSALLQSSDNEWSIYPDFGRHCDHEQLN